MSTSSGPNLPYPLDFVEWPGLSGYAIRPQELRADPLAAIERLRSEGCAGIVRVYGVPVALVVPLPTNTDLELIRRAVDAGLVKIDDTLADEVAEGPTDDA